MISLTTHERVCGLGVMIVACQVMDPGSNPGKRKFLFLFAGGDASIYSLDLKTSALDSKLGGESVAATFKTPEATIPGANVQKVVFKGYFMCYHRQWHLLDCRFAEMSYATHTSH